MKTLHQRPVRRALQRGAWLAALCAALLGSPSAPVAAAGAEPQRWDLRDLYATAQDWDAAYQRARSDAQALSALQTGFGDSAATLRQALERISDAQRSAGRLYVYASLQADEDLRVAPAQERRQLAQTLWTLIGEKSAWVAPAVQALGEERVRDYIAADPALKARFDFYLDDLLRNKPHTLSPESEALLAAGGVVLAQPADIYEQLASAELPKPSVRLANGQRVQLSTDAFERHRGAALRADRKRVFDGFFGGFKRFEGSLGAMLTAQVQGDVFSARARRHAGTLDAALFGDNMPPAVYRTLVEQANAGLPTLHRYLRLRQKQLGIPGTLAYYDNYPPLVRQAAGERYDLARSQAITLAALAPLGDEYLGLLKQGFAGRWTDSHPRPGKAQGGYMSGWAYDVHPYMLLNHNDDFESLSTVAHEWGHAVHTLLAKANQPFDKANYSTFIAESASIANEMLLSDHLVANAKTRQDKLFFLAQALESIRTTFFRQVMFAEFQLAMHEEVEQGRALSGQRLSDLYCGIARRYYGQAEGVMSIAPTYCTEWAYVDHFYKGYYVWQYATSMAGAAQFSDAILQEGAPAQQRFMRLLKAGGSDYPYTLYRQAGIDLAQPAPYQALMARMNRLMDQFEQLAAAPGR